MISCPPVRWSLPMLVSVKLPIRRLFHSQDPFDRCAKRCEIVSTSLLATSSIYQMIYIYNILYNIYIYYIYIYNILLLYRQLFIPPSCSCFRLDVPGTSWASPRDTKGTMAFNERTAQRSFCCSCDTKCCSSWDGGPRGFCYFRLLMVTASKPILPTESNRSQIVHHQNP